MHPHSSPTLSYSGSHNHHNNSHRHSNSHHHSDNHSPRYIHAYNRRHHRANTIAAAEALPVLWAPWSQADASRTDCHDRNHSNHSNCSSRSSRSHADEFVSSPTSAATCGRYRISKSVSTPRSRNASGSHTRAFFSSSHSSHSSHRSSSDDGAEDLEEGEIAESDDEEEPVAQHKVSLQPHDSHSDDDDGIADLPLPSPSPCTYPLSWSASKARKFKQNNLEQIWHDGQTNISRRLSDRTHDRLRLYPGVIFSAAHHTISCESSYLRPDATIAYDDPYRTNTAFGVVFSKFRKFVILRTFGLGVFCLPIYSHNGAGLSGKLNEEEYVAIRDSRGCSSVDSASEPTSKSEFESESESESDRPCVVAHMNLLSGQKPRPLLSAKSAIFLTDPVLFRFGTHLTIEGRLLEDDVTRLQALIRSFF